MKTSALEGVPFEISPGRLVQVGERVVFVSAVAGRLEIRRGFGGGVVFADTLAGRVEWEPPGPGMYLAELTFGGDVYRRPVAVVAEGWAVCQLTVGAFTSEDYAETIHGLGLAADYYVRLPQSPEPGSSGLVAFSAGDARWVEYERRHGDAIHAHAMARDFEFLAPGLAHGNANWDTLPQEGILQRLEALQEWWVASGYEPMDRIATYVPCNSFVQACGRAGIRILHSIIPEQNWSDGEWAINHWGMPNCPFWVAPDDFRKPGRREETGVLAMTMNHYGVLIPHLTQWGDHVLSPSHFVRWIRATESGPEPLRFERFARDTATGWRSLSGHPFFFSAGFEFGRTFGTRKMIDFNRRGIEMLAALAAETRLVFATSRDVLAYYDRHLPAHPESAFVQRDYWAGSDVSSKPLMAGAAAVVERRGYKAMVREGECLPLFHYDYAEPWHFATDDENAPDDHAPDDAQALAVRVADGNLDLCAEAALERTIPAVLWDATPAEPLPEGLSGFALPVLDDGRRHWLVEVPAGWRGEARVALNRAEGHDAPGSLPDWWKTQTFGEGSTATTYLSFDVPLIGEASIPIALRRPAFVEAVQGPVGNVPAGPVTLNVGPLRTWHRFHGLAAEDVLCTGETIAAVGSLASENRLLPADWPARVAAHIEKLEEAMIQRTNASKILLGVYCGANQPIRSQCRAAPYDIVRPSTPPLVATEAADGVIAFGPGRSFWYHPRNLRVRLRGLEALRGHDRVRLVLNTFHAQGPPCRFRVTCPGHNPVVWTPPSSPFDPGAFLTFDFPTDPPAGHEDPLMIIADQEPLLYDWWKEDGFIAALHALWFIAD